jgi:predicted dehydrogenase
MVVGVAVVGTGYWGKNYVRVFSELDQTFKLLYVVDTDQATLDKFQAKYSSVTMTTDMQKMLNDDRVQAVVIATPAVTHHSLAMQCIRAKKNLLVEKPLATTTKDAYEMVKAARSAGLVLMTGFTVLFIPAVQKAKEIIDDPSFGETYCLYSRRQNMGIVRNDVNVVWDLAPHDVAAFAYWLDNKRPLSVSAVGAKYLHGKHEDRAFITLTYPNNIIANAHVSWADPQKQRETVIISSNKRICVNDVNPLEPLRITNCTIKSVPNEMNYGEFQHITKAGDSISPYLAPAEPLKVQCQHFADCIEKKIPCIASGDMALDVVHILEAVDESLRNGGAPTRITYGEPAVNAGDA